MADAAGTAGDQNGFSGHDAILGSRCGGSVPLYAFYKAVRSCSLQRVADLDIDQLQQPGFDPEFTATRDRHGDMANPPLILCIEVSRILLA